MRLVDVFLGELVMAKGQPCTARSDAMGPLIAAFEDSLSLYVIPAAHAEISKYLQ